MLKLVFSFNSCQPNVVAKSSSKIKEAMSSRSVLRLVDCCLMFLEIAFLFSDSIWFSRVRRDAPRLSISPKPEKYSRKYSIEKENRQSSRKRSSMPYFEHDDRGEADSSDDDRRPKRRRSSRN